MYKIKKTFSTILILFIFGCTLSAKEQFVLGSKEAPVNPASYDESGFRNLIAEIADKTVPVVVSIKTSRSVAMRSYGEFWDEFFFGPGFQQNPQMQKRKEEGLGSGVIVSKDGYILTNNHVVEGAEEIQVVLFDDRVIDATIVGTDKQTDIAVIKLKKVDTDLPVAHLGDSDDLKIGEWVVAIGNPFGLNHTVTKGIVSAKEIHGRGISDYENFIQTDAAINPGNSGGALLNLSGSVIGINTAILSRTGGFQGIGFAVPINLAKKVVYDLIGNGKVTRGWLGISIQDITPQLAKALKYSGQKGVIISQVIEGTPAEKSDLKEGDIIISVNGKQMKSANELRNYIALLQAGSKATFEIVRKEEKMSITVTVGSRDSDALAITGGSEMPGAFGLVVDEIRSAEAQKYRIHPKASGVLVVSVEEGSAAASAGIQAGDVIAKVNHISTSSLDAYKKAIKRLSKNETAILLVIREDRQQFIALEYK